VVITLLDNWQRNKQNGIILGGGQDNKQNEELLAGRNGNKGDVRTLFFKLFHCHFVSIPTKSLFTC